MPRLKKMPVTCIACGETRKHFAKGFCRACYYKDYRAKKKGLVQTAENPVIVDNPEWDLDKVWDIGTFDSFMETMY